MSENCNHNCEGCQADFGSRKADFKQPANKYSHIKKVIGVVSGKGGVGKSLVTCLLPAVTDGGIKLMSINLLLESESAPVVWRGPVISGVINQFWSDVRWGELDYLFVDMPPGTGDVALTVFQGLPVDGIVIVTTPQDLVQMIVEKAFNMAKMMKVPVLGLVENMSSYVCPDCGKSHPLFGTSKVEETAAALGVPVLAKLPLDPAVNALVDAGRVEDVQRPELQDFIDVLKGYGD